MSARELKQEFPEIFIGGNLLRLCRICERTIGLQQKYFIDNGWSITHGICDRHFARMLRMASVPEKEVNVMLDKAIISRSEKKATATKDLENDPVPEKLMDWLKNPTPYSK